MNRQDLIHKLVDDAKPVRPLPSFSVRVSESGAVAILWAILGVLFFGIRTDFSSQLAHFEFWLETFSLMALSGWAAIDSLRLSVPGTISKTRYSWMPLLAAAVWIGSLLFRLIQSARSDAGFTLLPDHHFMCGILVLVMATVPCGFLGWMLAKAYPLQRSTAGALAGLASGTLGALGMQFVCGHSSAPHILIWHLVPVILSGLLGAGLFTYFSRPKDLPTIR